MTSIRIFIFSFVIFVSSTAYAGGGWTHAKGKGYFKLSQWWTVADKHFTNNGKTDPNITIGSFNTSFYGEYGLSDRLNVQLYFPFFSRSFHNTEQSKGTGNETRLGRAINSIGDTDIGVKYALIKDKPFVLSAHLWLGLPLGKNDFDPNNTTEEIALATGDGEFNQILGITGSTSKSLGGTTLFASLGAEFNNRSNGFSDETRVNFEIGGVIKEKLILVYKLRWLKSLQNGSSTMDNGSSIFSNNIEYISYTYELAYNISKKIGVTANYGSVYSAKLILASPSYSVGVYLNL